MGKKIQSSQPMVFDTLLPPLDDNFEIIASDTLVQWYNAKSGFKPDREETPLILTPKVSAFDGETGISYPNLSIASATWYKLVNEEWVVIPTLLASDIPETGDYVPAEDNPNKYVVIRTNAPASQNGVQGGLAYKCKVTYNDPRDFSESSSMEQTVLMTTNVDASITNPILELQTPSTYLYNPLTNASSLFTFKVRAMLGNDVVPSTYTWYASMEVSQGVYSEVRIDTLPCYKEATQQSGKGQGTDTIVLDAMYVNEINIVVKGRDVNGGNDYLSRAYATLTWSEIPIEAIAASKNGTAVGGVDRDMTFTSILNIKGTNPRALTDTEKLTNFLVAWKYRLASTMGTMQGTPDTHLLGYGNEVPVNSSVLRVSSRANSRLVWIEAEMLGAYEPITCDGEEVTFGNENVYCRF